MSDLPRDRDLPLCALDAVLEDAAVLVEEYAGYDEYAARRRIARRVVAHRARPAAGTGPGCGPGTGVPGTARSAVGGHLVLDAACHVRAARALDETARTLVESRDYAELALGADSWPHSAESTLLFAGLLHLAGKSEGAQFWFQYAAGAGSRTAARCLYLHHLSRAEVATARHWHDQSRQLPEEVGLPELPPVPHDLEEALSASVIWASPPITTQDLTALTAGPGRSRRTGYRLPPRLLLAATARTWTGDPDLGEVFLPALQVAIAIAHQARLPRARPSDGADVRVPEPVAHPRSPHAVRPSSGSAPVPAALESVHQALRVLEAVDRRSGGVSLAQIARETRLPQLALARAAGTLVRANLATPAGPGAYVSGGPPRPAGGPDDGRGSVRETLAWLRDAVGAAVYVARYTDGEVSITQYADGPATPAVDEWVDFRAAAHASAVGKALLAQLGHDGRTDHLYRHRPARFTPHTLGSREALFHQLDTRRPDAPLLDLEEYALGTVCAAVPITAGPNAECVALSIPVPDPGRLEQAARILRSEAAAVLLALIVAGGTSPALATEAGTGAAAAVGEAGQGRGLLSTTGQVAEGRHRSRVPSGP